MKPNDPVKIANDPTFLQALQKSRGLSSGHSASHYNIGRQAQQSTITNHFGKQAGFRNLGNSCYMSAIISVLVNLAPFVADLEA